MKKTKKNNKGFSLVELIVVVLIMAIIAVALAPQVMKWVGRSEISKDISVYEQVYSNLQTCVADRDVWDEVTATGNTITVTVSKDAAPAISGTDTDALEAEFAKVSGDVNQLKFGTVDEDAKITITDGVVKKDSTIDEKTGDVTALSTPATPGTQG